MKAGRNDPCPCGSGKKYKKCCLSKDEQESPRLILPPKATPPPELPPPAPAPLTDELKPAAAEASPPDPMDEARDALWEQFEQADLMAQVELFRGAVMQPELVDAPLAYEMLDRIYEGCLSRREPDLLDQLIEELRARLPDAYDAEEPYYLFKRFEVALVMHRLERLRELVLRLAELSGTHFDPLIWVLDRLTYHGQLELLVEAMHRAWPEVRGSEEIVPWAIDDFRRQAMVYEIIALLEVSPAITADDADLRARLDFYGEYDLCETRDYIERVSGRRWDEWSRDQFELVPPKQRKKQNDPAERRLIALSYEFLGWARRERGVAWSKAEMAREDLVNFMIDRRDGTLDDRRSPIEAMIGKQAPPRAPVIDALCPDRRRLDAYCGRLLHPMSSKTYQVAALIEIVPLWLEFILARGLIDAERHARTIKELTPLRDEVLSILEGFSDLAVSEGIRTSIHDTGAADAVVGRTQ